MNHPNPRDYIENWRGSDLPLGRRTLTALRNLSRRFTKLQNCCGHPGQPGC